MAKMVFIEPKAPNLHIFSKFPLPRLGSFLLGTLMKERGWDVEIFVEELGEVDFDDLRSADLVGISTITSTAPRAYAIADAVRGMGVPVIMGGPHVTFLPEEGLEHSDFVVRGEGEHALMSFIDQWENGRDFSSVPNLSYKPNGEIHHNPIAPYVCNLDSNPFPDLSLLKGKYRRVAGHLIIPIQTSRGCPFDCSFCSVTGMFGRKYRFRSTENIMEELRRYNERKNFVFFYDDNFAANPKRTKALLKAMIAEKMKFNWSTQLRTDVVKDLELVRLMKKAGCHTLFIGFESVNPASLKAMKKKQTVAEIVEAARILRRHRIHVHGMFVYGFDEDDWHTVKATVSFAKRAGLTSSQFLILTPFPGSDFYKSLASTDRITFDDWSLYDAHHVVFKPRHFSSLDLQRAQILSHAKFYSLMQMAKKFVEGRWVDLGLAAYARGINRKWKKRNRTFLKVLELLTPRKNTSIQISYHEKVVLGYTGLR